MGQFGKGSSPAKMPNKWQTAKVMGALLSDIFGKDAVSVKRAMQYKGLSITSVEDVATYIKNNISSIKQ